MHVHTCTYMYMYGYSDHADVEDKSVSLCRANIFWNSPALYSNPCFCQNERTSWIYSCILVNSCYTLSYMSYNIYIYIFYKQDTCKDSSIYIYIYKYIMSYTYTHTTSLPCIMPPGPICGHSLRRPPAFSAGERPTGSSGWLYSMRHFATSNRCRDLLAVVDLRGLVKICEPVAGGGSVYTIPVPTGKCCPFSLWS